MRLHDPHEAQDRRSGHQAVGVEGQHQVGVAAGAEFLQVAGLVAGIVGAPAVVDPGRLPVGQPGAPARDPRLLGPDHRRFVAVAEHVIMEGIAVAGALQALAHQGEACQGPDRVPRCAGS